MGFKYVSFQFTRNNTFAILRLCLQAAKSMMPIVTNEIQSSFLFICGDGKTFEEKQLLTLSQTNQT